MYKDLDEDPEYADEVRDLGSNAIPTFVRGHRVVIGFRPEEILDMLENL